MAKRRQLSTIDKLPPQIRELIAELRQDHGQTVDQILARLQELKVEVSRSAVGRHLKGLAELGDQMARDREMAKVLVSRFGDEPDHMTRMNLQLMQGVIMRIATATAQEEDGTTRPVTFDAEEAMFLSSALQKIVSAQKSDTDRNVILKREAAKEAAAAVDKVAARIGGGMSKETVAAIKAEILGIGR